MDLTSKTCKPCEGGTQPMDDDAVARTLEHVPGWKSDGDAITRHWRVKDFMAAVDFVRAVADIAEQEDHHPDLRIFGYKNVEVRLTTHAIGGLSENDFIVAAKIDKIADREV